MSKKYENNCNFEKYGKFLLKGQGVCFSPKASKFLHQIQLSNSFHLIYGLFCHVQYFNSKLRKTESNWLQFSPLTYRSSLLIVQWMKLTADQKRILYFAVTFFLPWKLYYFAVTFYFAVEIILFCREEFCFAVEIILFCRERFYFAVNNFILPWTILFCREQFYFAVRVVGHRNKPLHDGICQNCWL